ncbi:hypothetical protein ACFW1M_35240, partial [Streptomyces inhibens]
MSPQQGASPPTGPRQMAGGPVGAALRRARYLLEHTGHGLRGHRTVVGNAVRVTAASCVAFYLCRYGLDLTVMSVYATFTVVSLGALARIPGSGRPRAPTTPPPAPARSGAAPRVAPRARPRGPPPPAPWAMPSAWA